MIAKITVTTFSEYGCMTSQQQTQQAVLPTKIHVLVEVDGRTRDYTLEIDAKGKASLNED